MGVVSFSDPSSRPSRDSVITSPPVPPRQARDSGRRASVLIAGPDRYQHTASGGFCSVCGGVWPCARGSADEHQHRPGHRA